MMTYQSLKNFYTLTGRILPRILISFQFYTCSYHCLLIQDSWIKCAYSWNDCDELSDTSYIQISSTFNLLPGILVYWKIYTTALKKDTTLNRWTLSYFAFSVLFPLTTYKVWILVWKRMSSLPIMKVRKLISYFHYWQPKSSSTLSEHVFL